MNRQAFKYSLLVKVKASVATSSTSQACSYISPVVSHLKMSRGYCTSQQDWVILVSQNFLILSISQDIYFLNAGVLFKKNFEV